MKVNPLLPRGMRDFSPSEVLARRHVLNLIEDEFIHFGFLPLSTPALERIEVLTGKSGQETDHLTFKILKRGKTDGLQTDLGLRYDLTVPLARYIAMHPELTLPFKRYQMERVWRAERPQHGRYREFIQCDADIVGCKSLYADAEIIALTYSILNVLGFTEFHIRLNHRTLINASFTQVGISPELISLVAVSIDKMDKIGEEGVLADLENKGISLESRTKLNKILKISGTNEHRMISMRNHLQNNDKGLIALEELRQLLSILAATEIPPEHVVYDPYLIRGLDYYTGPVFESYVDEPRIGSLTGGGRYDKLIGKFRGEEIPATGTTIGFERVADVLQILGKMPVPRSCTHVLVTVFSNEKEMAEASIQIATKLRQADISCELYLEPGEKLAKQLRYADERGIPLAIILGPDEITAGTVQLKNLTTREQCNVPCADLYWKIAEILNL